MAILNFPINLCLLYYSFCLKDDGLLVFIHILHVNGILSKELLRNSYNNVCCTLYTFYRINLRCLMTTLVSGTEM